MNFLSQTILTTNISSNLNHNNIGNENTLNGIDNLSLNNTNTNNKEKDKDKDKNKDNQNK